MDIAERIGRGVRLFLKVYLTLSCLAHCCRCSCLGFAAFGLRSKTSSNCGLCSRSRASSLTTSIGIGTPVRQGFWRGTVRNALP